MGWHVAGNQLEHHVAAVLPPLAHQHPVIAILPMQCQAYRNPEIGQFNGKPILVGDVHRTPTLEDLGKIQRPPDALITQAFGSRFDE
ncbi:hypothetical protein D3C76_1766630 [compost metagenome]